jgi:WD40 repeat protein
MNYIRYLTIKFRSKFYWSIQHFGTNEGTDEGVSGLVGKSISYKERNNVIAKGGLLIPLIKMLVCRNDHMFRISRKKVELHFSSIVEKLRILHKCPRQPSLTRLIAYHSEFARDFAVDPTSGHVAVITDNFVDVLNSKSGGRMFHMEMKNSEFSNSVAFGGGDKSILAVCSGNKISLYEVPTVMNHQNVMSGIATLRCTQEITSSATVNTVLFSLDGCFLVIGLSNRTVQVWKKKHSDDGNEVWVCVETLPEQTGEITSVAFHQGPEILILAVGLNDNTITIWKISSDETKPSSCVDTLHGHSSCVRTLSFDHRFGMLASGSNDKTVKVWRPMFGGKYECALTLKNNRMPVNSVAFSRNGLFLASSGSISRSVNDKCEIWRIFMSATCVNAELVLTKFVESGIDQLNICPKTGNLQIRHYDGVSTLE